MSKIRTVFRLPTYCGLAIVAILNSCLMASIVPSDEPEDWVEIVPHETLGRAGRSSGNDQLTYIELASVIPEFSASPGGGLIHFHDEKMWGSVLAITRPLSTTVDFDNEMVVFAWDACNSFGVAPLLRDGNLEFTSFQTLIWCSNMADDYEWSGSEQINWHAIKFHSIVPESDCRMIALIAGILLTFRVRARNLRGSKSVKMTQFG